MNTHHSRLPLGRDQQGMTLVELMIAMVIGLIVLGAVSSVFISTRQTFRTTDSLSRIQESARYALEMMARDIRMTGYIGCGNLQTITVNTIANSPVEALEFDNALRGRDAPSGQIAGIDLVGSDTITIKGVFDGGVPLLSDLTPSATDIKIDGNPGRFATGDVLILSNCTEADVFRATSPNPEDVGPSEGPVTIGYSSTLNTGNLNGNYDAGTLLTRLAEITYFIGLNPTTLRPSLYRSNGIIGVGAATELADNVQDLRILYGEDINNDSLPDTYRNADDVDEWNRVASVRIQLVLVSPEENVLPEPQTYVFDGDTVTSTDNRMRQVFSTTVAMRNRLP